MAALFSHKLEDQLKESFFNGERNGFFVDVGANEPVNGSQTWRLEQLGWRGILIEPQPDLAEQLRQHRRASVYSFACSSPSNAGRSMPLHLAGVHSSFRPQHFVAGMRRYGVVEVPVTTLDQILSDANAPTPLDLVSIDVEAHELEVLDGFDLKRWQPRLILIEDLVMNLRLHRHVTAKGYKWFRRTGLNSWYIPADSSLDVDLFGHLQFFRKYYLGTPFRRLRERKRRLQTALGIK